MQVLKQNFRAAPVLFASTFKALNLGEKNSSTFKDFQGCVGTLTDVNNTSRNTEKTELLTCKTNGTYTNVNIYNELHREVQPPDSYTYLSTRSVTLTKVNLLLSNYTKVQYWECL